MIQIKKSLQRHFRFEQGIYWNRTLDDFKHDVMDAISENQMLAIIGAPGAGKNVLFDAAITSLNEKIVYVNVRNYYKEKLDISSIINAAIYDLSDESPRRDLEARSRQFVRIVGKKYTDEETKICILVNEGHRIHSNTYRAVKELREATYNGIGPLFSFIVTGHEALSEKIKDRKEVLFRCQTLELNESNNYYTFQMRMNYINKVFGEAVTEDAARRIAALCSYPLEINYYVEQKMEEAKRAGKKKIDGEVVKPSNKELKEALNLSLKDIADEAGMGKTTVHDVLNSPAHPQSGAVTQAIERLNKKVHGSNIKFVKAS